MLFPERIMSENNLLVSIGIIVHNEAANIAKLLNALKNQNLNRVVIREIIIVSSASTDATDEIVEEFSKQDKRITLIREKERRGKSAAINLFLKAANSEILIIESGDTIPAVDTVEKLIIPFFEQSIGMTGGRPVPENSPDNFIGYSVNLLWNLHHKMALINPKLGEMVAFRRLFENLPEQSAVDEASIEALIRSAGLKLKYIGDALVYNKGPENLRDFIKQRKRIAAGHLWLKDVQNYSVASQDKKLLIKLFLEELKAAPSRFFYLMGTVFIEIYSRILGFIDLRIRKKNPFKWEIADSTKNLSRN